MFEFIMGLTERKGKKKKRQITALGKDPKEIKQTTFSRAQFSFVTEIMNTKIIIKCPKDLYGSWQ